MNYAIYPYSESDANLVECLREKLNISCVISPKSWRVNENLQGIKYTSDFVEGIENVENIIILNNKFYKMTVSRITQAIESRKNIDCYMYLDKKDIEKLQSQAQANNVNFHCFANENSELINLIKERRGYFLSQECVVVSIGSLSPQFSNSDIIVKLKKAFETMGYKVSGLVSDINLELCGFHRLFPYKIDVSKDTFDEIICDLNSYSNYIQIAEKADVMLLQLPNEGMFRLYNNLPFSFGTSVYLASQAFNIDYGILTTGAEISEAEIFDEISDCFAKRYGFVLDAVLIKNFELDYTISLQNSEATYDEVSADQVIDCITSLKEKQGDIAFVSYISPDTPKLIVEDCIRRLSNNTSTF